MTDRAMRDEDQQREAAVAAFKWVANTLVDSIPQLIDDNMAYLSRLLPDPATGMTYRSHVWGAVWAAVGDEWFTYLLRHDHATLRTLLRAMWRRQLAWEEYAGA